MSDHDDAHGAHDDHEDDGRVTSPMQSFTAGQVGVGFAVLVVGLVVTFGLPLLF